MSNEITKEDIDELIRRTQKDFKRNATFLAVLFFIFGTVTYFVIINMPVFTIQEKEILYRIPRTGKELNDIALVIKSYSESNYYEVMAAFCCLYVFLQTFAIPGAIFLSILSGALFGGIEGFTLVCICATSGATICYWLSWVLGKAIIVRVIPGMIIKFSEKLREQRGNLFWYLLFLRITPLLPNWFINISSPILDIPLKYFVWATFFGLMPLNIVHCRTGLILSEVNQVGGFDFKQIIWLFALGFVALLPTLFKGKLEEAIEKPHLEKGKQKAE